MILPAASCAVEAQLKNAVVKCYYYKKVVIVFRNGNMCGYNSLQFKVNPCFNICYFLLVFRTNVSKFLSKRLRFRRKFALVGLALVLWASFSPRLTAFVMITVVICKHSPHLLKGYLVFSVSKAFHEMYSHICP